MISSLKNRLRRGTVSAVELYAEALDRVENGKHLNAVVHVNGDGARSAADSQKRLQNGTPRPLEGIPIAVKDNFCTKGMATTCASKMLKDFVPVYDATVVARLKQAGAVLVGKTNMDEFAMGSGTVDSIYGPTINAWSQRARPDEWRIAGGSSGGSCTAVAAGMCVAALGSDTGGSVRNPASYCGVVGYKPSYGLLSRHGLVPLINSMDVPGVTAKTVEDVMAVMSAIVGPDSNDCTCVSVDFDVNRFEENFSVDRCRIGIPEEYGCEFMSDEVKETWTFVANLVDDFKGAVEKVSMPHTSASIATYSVLNACEVASNMSRYTGLIYGYRSTKNHESFESLIATNRMEGLGDVVRSRILSGNFFLLRSNYEKYFMQALRVRRLISDDFKRVWKSNYDFLVTPTTLTTAPLLSEFTALDNRTQCATQDYCTQPANMAGCPAISIPVKLSSNKMPIGIQIMAANFDDVRLLQFAKWLEKTLQFSQNFTRPQSF